MAFSIPIFFLFYWVTELNRTQMRPWLKARLVRLFALISLISLIPILALAETLPKKAATGIYLLGPTNPHFSPADRTS